MRLLYIPLLIPAYFALFPLLLEGGNHAGMAQEDKASEHNRTGCGRIYRRTGRVEAP